MTSAGVEQRDESAARGPRSAGLIALPSHLLRFIESFLCVQDLLTLSAASADYVEHYDATEWRSIFLMRWGREYREGVDQSFVEYDIFLSASLRDFWTTVEAGLMAGPSTAFALAGERLDWSSARSAFEQVFLLLQPGFYFLPDKRWVRGRFLPKRQRMRSWGVLDGSDPGRRRDALLWSGGRQRRSMQSAAVWKRVCIIRDRGDDLLQCRICNTLDLFSQGMRRSEAWGTNNTTWIAPCQCPAVVHRSCSERLLGLGGLFAPSVSWDEAAAAGLPSRVLAQCPDCGCSVRMGWKLPENLAQMVVCAARDGISWKRLRGVVLASLVAFLAVGLAEGRCADQRIGAFGARWRWPDTGGPVLAWWIVQQLLLLQVFFSERFSRVVQRLWHGPIFRFYVKLYGYFLLANIIMGMTFTPLLERCRPGYEPPQLVWTAVRWLNAASYFVVSNIVLYVNWKTNYRVATVADSGVQSDPGASFPHPLLSLDLPR